MRTTMDNSDTASVTSVEMSTSPLPTSSRRSSRAVDAGAASGAAAASRRASKPTEGAAVAAAPSVVSSSDIPVVDAVREAAAATVEGVAVAISAAGKTSAARDAFFAGDVEASRSLHEALVAPSEAKENHGGVGSDFIKSIVFGGLDGIITTLSTIAASVGGQLSIEAVVTLAFANLIADGISMGVGDFLSSKAEYDYLLAEKAREEWEFDNHPDGEKEEMVDLLKEKGLDHEDAAKIIDVVAKPEHRDFFVEYMMTEELGLEIPDDPWGPAKDGAVTFVSFCLFGFIPLLVYIISWAAKWNNAGGTFGCACAATVVALYALGAVQGLITRLSTVKAGLFMAINGSLACAAAYLVGWGLMKAVGNGC